MESPSENIRKLRNSVKHDTFYVKSIGSSWGCEELSTTWLLNNMGFPGDSVNNLPAMWETMV